MYYCWLWGVLNGDKQYGSLQDVFFYLFDFNNIN